MSSTPSTCSDDEIDLYVAALIDAGGKFREWSLRWWIICGPGGV